MGHRQEAASLPQKGPAAGEESRAVFLIPAAQFLEGEDLPALPQGEAPGGLPAGVGQQRGQSVPQSRGVQSGQSGQSFRVPPGGSLGGGELPAQLHGPGPGGLGILQSVVQPLGQRGGAGGIQPLRQRGPVIQSGLSILPDKGLEEGESGGHDGFVQQGAEQGQALEPVI